MLPIAPYTPLSQQTTSTTNYPSNITFKNTATATTSSVMDTDWIVRFCYWIIIIPKLLVVLEVFIWQIRNLANGNGYTFSGLSLTIITTVIQMVIFFVCIQFIKNSQDYKKILISLLVSMIVVTYVIRFLPYSIGYPFNTIQSTQLKTGRTSCSNTCDEKECTDVCTTVRKKIK